MIDTSTQRVAPGPGILEGVSAHQINLLVSQIAELDPSLTLRVRQILEILHQPEVRVTFSGHFSAGKSTILNAALGRDLLPVDDYPETGAICFIRPGDDDYVTVHRTGTTQVIPCTTDAIRQEASLIAENGEMRSAVTDIRYLTMSLAGTQLPPQACWIDAPGINDTEVMGDRALAAAQTGDILAWVISTRQPLSEVEVSFLAEYVRVRGAAGLVFIVNAFLKDGPPEAIAREWEDFSGRRRQFYLNKIRDQAPAMGLNPDALPPVIVVAGRAAAQDGSGAYGLSALRQLVGSLDAPTAPLVAVARLQRVEHELRTLADGLLKQYESEQAQLLAQNQQGERSRAETRRLVAQFQRETQDLVPTHLQAWEVTTRQTVAMVVNQITPATLKRDDTYSIQITAALQYGATASTEALLQGLANLAATYAQGPLVAAQADEVRRRLLPAPVVFQVPQHEQRKTGANIGVFAGAGIGCLVAIGLGLVGAVLFLLVVIWDLFADVSILYYLLAFLFPIGGLASFAFTSWAGREVGTQSDQQATLLRDTNLTRALLARAADQAIAGVLAEGAALPGALAAQAQLNAESPTIIMMNEALIARKKLVADLVLATAAQIDDVARRKHEG